MNQSKVNQIDAKIQNAIMANFEDFESSHSKKEFQKEIDEYTDDMDYEDYEDMTNEEIYSDFCLYYKTKNKL